MAIVRYRKLSKDQKKLAFAAIDFCVSKFTPRLKDKLTIRIFGIPGLMMKEGIFADCMDNDPFNKLPREFEIRIDNCLDNTIFLRTILHEMVHVKQYAKGEMRDLVRVSSRTVKFRDEKILTDKMQYWDYPWEIEAHGREHGLMIQFVEKHPEFEEMIDLCDLGEYNYDKSIESYKVHRPTQMVLPFDR